MENNPIQVMLNEHDVICQAEKIVEKLKDLWTNNENKYREAVATLIIFFREFADGYHHRKEEEVLFPAIFNHPDFILQEIIEEFENHHEDFRDYVKEIENAINNKEYLQSYHELNKYLQDLLDHIAAENDELFVLAESLLSEEELETIYFKFMDIDRELGVERKKELEESLKNVQ